MVTYNIFGDCVSRDILECKVKNGTAKVNQYVSFVNPLSLFSEKCELEYDSDQFVWGTNFSKRNLKLDFEKSVLDYLFEKKSDYIILNPLDMRMNLFCKDGMTFTKSNIVVKNENLIELAENDSWVLRSFDSYKLNEYIDAWDRLMNVVLEHYAPEQVILHIHYGVNDYLKNNFYFVKFSDNAYKSVVKYNKVVKALFEHTLEQYQGIRYIPFPEKVFGDSNNHWGTHPLHYSEEYYQYGEKALAIIEQNSKDEQNQLDLLRTEYNTLFLEKKVANPGQVL